MGERNRPFGGALSAGACVWRVLAGGAAHGMRSWLRARSVRKDTIFFKGCTRLSTEPLRFAGRLIAALASAGNVGQESGSKAVRNAVNRRPVLAKSQTTCYERK